MSATAIEWTDRVWNPVTGCTKISPGCDHCYAENIARRFAGSKAFPDGFAPTLHSERLDAPLRWRGRRKVFVNSMSDLFHDTVPDEFIAQVFAVMALTPGHTYQILTKRHGRMRSLLGREDFHHQVHAELATRLSNPLADSARSWPLPNVWLGVSVEDQARAQLRVPALLDTPAAVRWLSCEPLLGPLDLTPWLDRLDWVVLGGESGPGARPMCPYWARDVRDQCAAADVPFFFKQWGEWAPTGAYGIGNPSRRSMFVGPPVEMFGHPHYEEIARVGKKQAGRLLDGRTWDQYPDEVSAGVTP